MINKLKSLFWRGSEALAVDVAPARNIEALTASGSWRVLAAPARLAIAHRSESLPHGWILLRAKLHRRGGDYSARLFADTGVAETEMPSFDIPVTLKGTVLELVKLPRGTQRLLLQPMNAAGHFDLLDFSITPIGHAERIARTIRRVLPMYFSHSREYRHRLGLRTYTPLLDLQKAYQIVGRMRAYSPTLSYRQWIERFDLLTDHDRRRIRLDFRRWKDAPRFEVLLVHQPEDGSGQLGSAFASLDKQLYRNFEVTLVAVDSGLRQDSPSERSAAGAPLATGTGAQESLIASHARCHAGDTRTWIVVLDASEVLAEHALYWLASAAVRHPSAGLLYSDHDYLDTDNKRSEPVFKPDWSPELLRSTNYVGPAVAIRSDALVRAGGIGIADLSRTDNHDLLFRVSERLATKDIQHVQAVLWHLPGTRRGKAPALTTATLPVLSHLQRLGVSAEVDKTAFGHYRLKYALPARRPKVSVIVPTRDALPHLRRCIESLLSKSTYDAFEIIIVDNQSTDPEALSYLDALRAHERIRILPYEHEFNYSAINNFAARAASGEVLCLLNNDTAVISADWLEEMLGHLVQPGVGVVGAKLLYSDGRVQHGGDTVGPGGCAHHLHSFIDRHAPGYCDRAILAQDLSAVTGACLLTWKHLYFELDGLNERNLPVAFNDVDYCLRVRRSGHWVVWTPHAELYHHESISRGKDDNPEKAARAAGELAYMREHWRHIMNHDPFYNQNLSYARPDFSLSSAPMVQRPWRK